MNEKVPCWRSVTHATTPEGSIRRPARDARVAAAMIQVAVTLSLSLLGATAVSVTESLWSFCAAEMARRSS